MPVWVSELIDEKGCSGFLLLGHITKVICYNLGLVELFMAAKIIKANRLGSGTAEAATQLGMRKCLRIIGSTRNIG